MAETSNITLIKSVIEEAPAAPDSTTSMFVEGEDVLVDRHHTGQFFMGTIVQIDRSTEKCLLRFLDNKECWAHLSELQRVKDDPGEILCVLCKKIDRNVVRCTVCDRGYHRSCLEENLRDGERAADGLCLRCLRCAQERKRGKLSISETQPIEQPSLAPKYAPSKNSSKVESNAKYVAKQSLMPSTSIDFSQNLVKKPRVRNLPYTLQSLIWDEFHRVNDTQQYCYCGKPGDWYMQMLQCVHCRQWFHQDCLSCLHFPLYCGDQLYIFLCSVCNDDEFLRRFDFGWVDIVHLVIFNLILFKKKKYFDVDSEIIPYVKNNWFYLQIPAQLVKCSDAELRRIILKMLEDNSTKNCRFKFAVGKESKPKKRIWGLRNKVPPKRIPFSLPPVRPLTDDAVKAWWKNCHISFREPLDCRYLMRGDIVLQPDGQMSAFDFSLMLGQASSLSCISSRNLKEAALGVHLLDSSILRNKFSSSIPVNGLHASGHNSESFTCYAKKSSAFCASNRLTLQESLRRNKQAHRNRVSPRSKVLGKKEQSIGDQSDDVQENSSQDGYDSLDSLTSFSQDDTCVSSNAVSQDEESLDENELSQDGYDSGGEESDVGAEGSASTSTRLSLDDCQSGDSQDEFKLEIKAEDKDDEKVVLKQIACDPIAIGQQITPSANEVQEEDLCSATSGVSQPGASPATYSVLPSAPTTPADTEVEENSRGPSDTQPSRLPSIADLIGGPIVLEKEPTGPTIPPLPRLTPVIKEPPQARPVKRKLSEKDIKIVNGQVKQRRRLRRYQSNQSNGISTVHLDSGEKLEKRIVGGKLLRSPHKPPVPESVPEVIPPQGETLSSSASTNHFERPEELSVSDVKKDIKSIFNARNRIASGEKFSVKGRRVTADGVEYLIQWDYSL